jgi:predicted site-specific integrase-resolvase
VSADYKGEEVIDEVGSGLSSQRLFVDDRFSTGFRNQSDAALMEHRARAVRGVKSKTLCANSHR